MNYCLTLRKIHVDVEDLNVEAATLAAIIKKNMGDVGV